MATTTITFAPVVEDARPKNSPLVWKGDLLPPPETYHTIDGLVRSHASEPEDFPLVAYPATGVADFEVHSARDLDRYTNAAVARYRELGLEPAVSASSLLAKDELKCLEADLLPRTRAWTRHLLRQF